jgi:hypothetical protein
VAATAAWRQALAGCGYTLRDTSLGDASVAGTSRDGADAVVISYPGFFETLDRHVMAIS